MAFRRKRTLAERIRDSVKVDANGCWRWQQYIDPKGYGQMTFDREGIPARIGAHRVSYEVFVGPIPGGLGLDHLCRVRDCVNPKHLEPVTQHENLHRSPTCPAALNARKTHCKHGHEFTPENTYHYLRRGRYQERVCRACNLAATYRRDAKRLLRAVAK